MRSFAEAARHVEQRQWHVRRAAPPALLPRRAHSIGSLSTPISCSCAVRRMVIAMSSAPLLNASVSSADRPTRSSRRTLACVLAKSRSRSGRPLSAKSCVVPIDTRPSARAPLRLSQASRCAARMRRAWPTRSSPASRQFAAAALRRQQRLADHLFQPLHLRGHRRRRAADHRCGARQRAAVDKGEEGAQQVGIERFHTSIVWNLLCKTIRFFRSL